MTIKIRKIYKIPARELEVGDCFSYVGSFKLYKVSVSPTLDHEFESEYKCIFCKQSAMHDKRVILTATDYKNESFEIRLLAEQGCEIYVGEKLSDNLKELSEYILSNSDLHNLVNETSERLLELAGIDIREPDAPEKISPLNFPIMKVSGDPEDLPRSIPWKLLDTGQARLNHGQSLEELARRGGLTTAEAWSVAHRKQFRPGKFAKPVDDIPNYDIMLACVYSVNGL